MAKTLYLMRHGQTMLNKQRRIQGWFDSPLTELGRYQARGAGVELQRRGVKFDRAICSTSERCFDTLELVFDGMELPVSPMLACGRARRFIRVLRERLCAIPRHTLSCARNNNGSVDGAETHGRARGARMRSGELGCKSSAIPVTVIPTYAKVASQIGRRAHAVKG